jgi:hypothetical protein
MPHYKDGTEAKVGDLIKGQPYNTKRVIVGEVLQVTPATEACNLVVTFPTVHKADEVPYGKSGTHFQGNEGKRCIEAAFDYGETRAFELVHRPE